MSDDNRKRNPLACPACFFIPEYNKPPYLDCGGKPMYEATGGDPLPSPAPLKDMKAALNSGLKPDVTHVRYPLMVYTSRNCEFGNDRYQRANYLRPVDGIKPAFERYRGYLRALVAHAVRNLDAMERHQALDPDLLDIEGMKKAAYAVDLDPSPIGPSKLPHIGGSCASLNMAITQAVDAGLLPADPGQPWKAK